MAYLYLPPAWEVFYWLASKIRIENPVSLLLFFTIWHMEGLALTE